MTKDNSINMNVENFRRTLINAINQSGLPISIAYYIYKDVGQELKSTYYDTLNSEMEEQQIEPSDPTIEEALE